MKKFVSLLCLIVILSSFCGCSKSSKEEKPLTYAETSQEYLNEVADKCYIAKHGQILVFYKDGVATYDFRNGVGENHHYNYRVILNNTSEDAIEMSFIRLEDVNDKYYTHDYIEGSEETLTFNRKEQNIAFYALTYDCISSDSIHTEDGKGFTNKCGTPTTVCEESGCNRFIAPSGETNFCTEHTNVCLDCKMFLNYDRTRCADCAAKPDYSDNDSGECPRCNGSGYIKYYYGDSDLQAYLDGQNPYTVGKCTSCG